MTNPLTEQEMVACEKAFMAAREFRNSEDCHQHGFAVALDYLRAELAKEEPEAFLINYREIAKDGQPKNVITASLSPLVPTFYNDASVESRTLISAKKLYLRSSEPSKCPFIETSKGGTSYCRLAAGSTSKEKDHG